MNKISIIIPFYNSIKTIEKCLNSVLAQDYKNFEAILVNDGGNDGSLEVVKSYAKKDSRIVVLDKEHSGVSDTRNFGIKHATGDYIQFLDSDDYIESNMFSRMLDEIIKNDADLVVCNYTHPSIKNYLSDTILNMSKKADILKYCQVTFGIVVPWNKLYKRSVITDLYDKDVAFCEDDLFALTNLKNIKKIVSISDELYHYYVAPKDTSLDESSCINKMAKDPDFWKTKNTYWYMRRPLVEKSLASLKTHLDYDLAEDCAYARMFDFMIWELLIMHQIGASEEGLVYEIIDIFSEKEFLKSLELREKYGLKLKDMSIKEYKNKVREYATLCFNISNYSHLNPNFKAFNCCMYLFAEMFMEKCGKLDSSDILVRAYLELETELNLETEYLRNRHQNLNLNFSLAH